MGTDGKKGDPPVYLEDFHHHPIWFAQDIALDHIPACDMVGIQEPGLSLQQDPCNEVGLYFRALTGVLVEVGFGSRVEANFDDGLKPAIGNVKHFFWTPQEKCLSIIFTNVLSN
jgi:hypothetical protein